MMHVTPEKVAMVFLLGVALYPAYLALRELIRGHHIQCFDDFKTPEELLRGSIIVPKTKKISEERKL